MTAHRFSSHCPHRLSDTQDLVFLEPNGLRHTLRSKLRGDSFLFALLLIILRDAFELLRLAVGDLANVFCGLMILLHGPAPRKFIPRFFTAVTPGKNDQGRDHHQPGETMTQEPFFHIFLFLPMTQQYGVRKW